MHLLRVRHPLLLARHAPRALVASTDAIRNVSTTHANVASAPAHVTARMFAGLLRKCGLSPKVLRALDAAAQQHTHNTDRNAFPLAVALSGGADSMALTLLLREHLRFLNIQTPLLAITVNHGLRPESAQEARDVGHMVADKWGVEHTIVQCDWAADCDSSANDDTLPQPRQQQPHEPRKPTKPRSSKLQEEARRYRYALLQQVCCTQHVRHLFVAHNLGDQLETVLFRLGRASGINGLAGIASVSTLQVDPGDDSNTDDSFIDALTTAATNTNDTAATVSLVRPLLSISKPQLKATCDYFDQEWIEDPSNDKVVFDRIRIRKELERLEAARGPQMQQLVANFQQSAARAKHEFARAERHLFRTYAVSWASDHVVLKTAFVDDPTTFEELRVRLVSAIVRIVGSKQTPPRLAAATRLVRDLRSLESGKSLTLSGCRVTKKAKGSLVHFTPER